MFERHQILIVKNLASEKRRYGDRGYILAFECEHKRVAPYMSLKNSQDSYFDITQDAFCEWASFGRDRFLKKYPEHKIRVFLVTIFDDERLNRECESLFYHWWATNRDIMLGDFETIRV